MQNRNIFISFVEEFIQNPDYQGYVGGRIEISHPKDHYPSEEIRFFTNKTDLFYDFRDTWDMKDITSDELEILRGTVRLHFTPHLG